MSTSPILMRLARCFLSALPHSFVWTFGVSGLGGSGVVVVFAIIVWEVAVVVGGVCQGTLSR
jgi:hypothetical protein